MILREYQQDAIDAVYQHLRDRDDNPCVVIPTAGGKTPVMAVMCRDAVTRWQGRVLIVAHVRELLEQAVDKLNLVAPEMSQQVGLYSAGLKSRDTEQPVIVAGVQSVFRRAAELGRFDLVIIDEAHYIPPDGDGMYRTLIAGLKETNPNLRIIGLTATPYRMTSGPICAPENVLNKVCYEVGVRELIVQGFLCPLVSKAGRKKADTSNLHVRSGEFIANEVEDLMNEAELVESACREVLAYTRDRKACLIFTSGVKHGAHVAETLRRLGVRVETVFGDTLPFERDRVLQDFRAGNIPYLVNVNVLTTGFDAPNIDCVAMLRPTLSPGLFYQMCLDMDTEVLTPGGWRRCHEVTTGEMVASFDINFEEVVYTPAQGKVHRALLSHEFMVGISSPHLDIRVTDQHNMVVRCKSHSAKLWQIQPAWEMAQRRETYTIPIAGSGKRHDIDAPLTDDEVSFLGWFLTDGYHNRSTNVISITQSLVKFSGAVRAMLVSCGFGIREYIQHRNGKEAGYKEGIHFVIPYGQPRGGNAGKRGWKDLAAWIDKDVPAVYDSLSFRQFRILLNAMNLANGHHSECLSYKKRTMDITVGCRRRMADRIQQLAIERGFRCNVTTSTPKPSGWNTHPQRQWMLHIREQRIAYIGGTTIHPNALVPNRCSFGPVAYERNEWVWCLTTEHGTLVTRRNGKVAILGNCGRGFRLCENKENCLVLDFGGNVLRHGPVDAIQVGEGKASGHAPAKECPECQLLMPSGYSVCPDCGYEFFKRPVVCKPKHGAHAEGEGILSGQVTTTEHEVLAVAYSVHQKRGAPEDAPKTLRVDYKIGIYRFQSEWICLEHTGWAREKATAWWRLRSETEPPKNVADAVDLAYAGALAETKAITIRRMDGEKYDRIVGYVLGDKPAGWNPDFVFAGEEIPF